MRPAPRLLSVAGGVTALALVGIAALPDLAPLAVLGLVAVAVAACIDLLAARPFRPIELDISGPAEAFAGTSANFALTLRGSGARAHTRAVVDTDPALGTQHRLPLGRMETGRAQGVLRLTTTRRGRFAITAVWARWTSPARLWELHRRFPCDTTLNVVPNIAPISSGQIDTMVRSDLYGVKDTDARGTGSEFHQLREFTAGMDSRAIDWKHSARMRTLVAKQMRAERNHQIILTLDNGYLMRAQTAGRPRIDHAITAALSVAWAAGIGGDLAGLYSYDARPGPFQPPQPARAGFARLRAQMAALDYTSVETNHTLGLAHLNGRLNRRSLIIIFTDFVDTTAAELLLDNLAVLSRNHVVLFVTLRDPDLDAALDGTARTPDAVARAVVASGLLAERAAVLERLERLGVMCLDTAPQLLTAQVLSAYLNIKVRELI